MMGTDVQIAPKLNSQMILDTLILSEGNIALTAERLNCNPRQLIEVLINETSCAQILNQQLRVIVLLKLYDSFMKTQIAFLASLPDMSPKDIAKTYIQIAEQISNLAIVTQTQDTPEAIFKMLPENVREALVNLMQNE